MWYSWFCMSIGSCLGYIFNPLSERHLYGSRAISAGILFAKWCCVSKADSFHLSWFNYIVICLILILKEIYALFSYCLVGSTIVMHHFIILAKTGHNVTQDAIIARRLIGLGIDTWAWLMKTTFMHLYWMALYWTGLFGLVDKAYWVQITLLVGAI